MLGMASHTVYTFYSGNIRRGDTTGWHIAILTKKKSSPLLTLDQAAERLTSILDKPLSKLSVEERMKRTKKALRRVKSELTSGGTRSTPAGRDCTPPTRLVARSR